MVESIKVNGLITSNLVMDIKNFIILLFIKALILKESRTVMVNINGKMDKFTKVNGKMV